MCVAVTLRNEAVAEGQHAVVKFVEDGLSLGFALLDAPGDRLSRVALFHASQDRGTGSRADAHAVLALVSGPADAAVATAAIIAAGLAHTIALASHAELEGISAGSGNGVFDAVDVRCRVLTRTLYAGHQFDELALVLGPGSVDAGLQACGRNHPRRRDLGALRDAVPGLSAGGAGIGADSGLAGLKGSTFTAGLSTSIVSAFPAFTRTLGDTSQELGAVKRQNHGVAGLALGATVADTAAAVGPAGSFGIFVAPRLAATLARSVVVAEVDAGFVGSALLGGPSGTFRVTDLQRHGAQADGLAGNADFDRQALSALAIGSLGTGDQFAKPGAVFLANHEAAGYAVYKTRLTQVGFADPRIDFAPLVQGAVRIVRTLHADTQVRAANHRRRAILVRITRRPRQAFILVANKIGGALLIHQARHTNTHGFQTVGALGALAIGPASGQLHTQTVRTKLPGTTLVLSITLDTHRGFWITKESLRTVEIGQAGLRPNLVRHGVQIGTSVHSLNIPEGETITVPLEGIPSGQVRIRAAGRGEQDQHQKPSAISRHHFLRGSDTAPPGGPRAKSRSETAYDTLKRARDQIEWPQDPQMHAAGGNQYQSIQGDMVRFGLVVGRVGGPGAIF